MKTLLMFGILAGAMSAQDINGVSLTGISDNPLLVNNSTKAVIGWTVARFDADGNMLPADRIVLVQELKEGGGIQPGESQKPQIHNTINFSARRTAVTVKLDSVLFADGEVAGPDVMGPEFAALEGFTHQLQGIQEDFGVVPRFLNVPTPWSKTGHNKVAKTPRLEPSMFEPLSLTPYDIIPPLPCSTNGGCYTIQYYSGDQSKYGTVYGTPAGVETDSVGGSAVCGPDSPNQGYGIGDNVNATIFCPVSTWYGVSTEGTKRADFQPDRIVQGFSIYDPYNNALQNNARFHELCAYSELPNRGGRGPFGKAVTEYNYSYGCP